MQAVCSVSLTGLASVHLFLYYLFVVVKGRRWPRTTTTKKKGIKLIKEERVGFPLQDNITLIFCERGKAMATKKKEKINKKKSRGLASRLKT